MVLKKNNYRHSLCNHSPHALFFVDQETLWFDDDEEDWQIPSRPAPPRKIMVSGYTEASEYDKGSSYPTSVEDKAVVSEHHFMGLTRLTLTTVLPAQTTTLSLSDMNLNDTKNKFGCVGKIYEQYHELQLRVATTWAEDSNIYPTEVV